MKFKAGGSALAMSNQGHGAVMAIGGSSTGRNRSMLVRMVASPQQLNSERGPIYKAAAGTARFFDHLAYGNLISWGYNP